MTTFAGSSASHVVERRFDAADRLDRITYPDASQVTLGYDSLGRLRTVTGAVLLADSRNKFGGLDYFGGSRGGGARFDGQGNFLGFLEP